MALKKREKTLAIITGVLALWVVGKLALSLFGGDVAALERMGT